MSKIGFIGLGIMGKGMAYNLVSKLPCETFMVWNRSMVACEELSAKFPGKITIAKTPAEVIRACPMTYSMLSTMEASEAVFDLEGDGVIAGVTEGRIIIDCATLSPERMQHISKQVAAKGGKFLEAPVSGSKVPAETGTLIFLCGGDADVYETALPGLEAMGKANFLLGDVGAGSRMKLVVNMLMGTMMTAFSEGMSLCEKSDLPQDKLLEVRSLVPLLFFIIAWHDMHDTTLTIIFFLLLTKQPPNVTSYPYTCTTITGIGFRCHGQPYVQRERPEHDQGRIPCPLPSKACSEGHSSGSGVGKVCRG